MKKIKVAVIGFGHLGKWHVEKVLAHSPVVELALIVENFEKNRLEAIAKYPNTKVVENVTSHLEEFDAAVIVTPTSTHFELAKYLIQNNKHVFCEKPLTENLHESLELKKLLGQKDLVLQVGHSERFHEVFFENRNWSNFFNSDGIISLKRVAPFKGRATDVDVVSDLMIHDLDLMLYLFKETPTSVTSYGKKMRTNHYDYVHSTFKFKSKKIAFISVGRNQAKEVRELEIISNEGTIVFDLMNYEVSLAKSNAMAPNFVEKIPFLKRDHLFLEHQYFYDSILNQKKPVVSVDDGVNAVLLIEKVRESLVKEVEVFI